MRCVLISVLCGVTYYSAMYLLKCDLTAIRCDCEMRGELMWCGKTDAWVYLKHDVIYQSELWLLKCNTITEVQCNLLEQNVTYCHEI